MKIDYHHRAWNCPKCERCNRVRHLGNATEESSRWCKCRCGKKVFITTELVPVTNLEVSLINVEDGPC